ncbi:MAG TPA: bifunctional phosphoserine phosphatase/homoserine phosphotransferase ThrH [Polyangiales bacterium]|nr:bifunctional phosphoserine phosphatase/homoserine phosphotransferase ThrH [Polyangiales bacterium]
MAPLIVCLDLEGVLIPEVWIAFAEKTGIEALRRTTRDEPDYDALMQGRLEILDAHGFKLGDIQDVISSMEPLPGARDFLDTLRDRTQLVILSDTFYQFAAPFMRQLGQPTLFCHQLVTDDDDRVVDYELRIPDGKRKAVAALRDIGFRVHAAGDSYNDTTMLTEADRGILFRCPDNVAEEFPQFQRTEAYDELLAALLR